MEDLKRGTKGPESMASAYEPTVNSRDGWASGRGLKG